MGVRGSNRHERYSTPAMTVHTPSTIAHTHPTPGKSLAGGKAANRTIIGSFRAFLYSEKWADFMKSFSYLRYCLQAVKAWKD